MDDHRVFVRPPVWLPVVVALVAGGLYVTGKYVETRHMDQFTITVSGTGKVSAVPDIATLNFGVQTGRQKTADGAMKILTKRMTAIVEAIEGAGVEEKDIHTQHLSLNPAYDWNDGKRVDRGFEARQSLMVKVRDLDEISNVLDKAVKAGANQAGSVGFTIDDPETLKEEARAKAIEDAEKKAWKLAGDLGVGLGALSGFWEETHGYGGPRVMMMEAKAMDGGFGGSTAPPVPAGEQEVQVQVNLTYKVKK